MKLSINIGGYEFANPVTVASGTFPHAEKYYSAEEVLSLGAIVPKTVTLYAQQGNPPPRIHETPSGMLNAIGIENPGAEVFIREKLPALTEIGVPLIISVLGHSQDEFLALAEMFRDVKGVAALELNLSCPNLGHKTLVAQDPKATQNVVETFKKNVSIPVIAKLSPNVTDITMIAQAAEAGGADALSLINTLTGMAINIHQAKPILGNVTGGLSGPAIRPVAVHMVYAVHKVVNIPIIGMGGIMTADDALEFIMAGASMVAVGTSNFINRRQPLDVLSGIKDFMKRKNVTAIDELIGSAVHSG